MLTIVRTHSENADFIPLVKLLDEDLAIRDGDEHAFYNQFNKIVSINHVVIAYGDGTASGCGAIKHYDEGVMEVKRMFVLPEKRGLGIGGLLLQELEKWAKELGYRKCILETGVKQPEAIALYNKSGYRIIPNYGQYLNVENSVCFEKEL